MMKRSGLVLLVAIPALVLAGRQLVDVSEPQGSDSESVTSEIEVPEIDLLSRALSNPTAYIPSQCYTRTLDQEGIAHNPCYSCHTRPRRPNFVDDSELQVGYTFAWDAQTNHWDNLFKDRSEAVAAISDEAMTGYIRKSNYFSADEGGEAQITLAARLNQLPPEWDYDGDGRWDGYVPDAWFDFDDEGFDRAPDGGYSGWRAFAYYPFLGTFWPTNGSTDDVLIRLPEAFRRTEGGSESLSVYKVNLAIVEAMVKERNVPIEVVDERVLGGVDLDKDGRIGMAGQVVYQWAPVKKQYMWYVGQARRLQLQGELDIAAGLYPEGTEFLHSVRYIDVDEAGTNLLTPRMKELRYAIKRKWMNYAQHRARAEREFKEKSDFPDRIRTVLGNVESGVSNGQGWVYAGFIEDAAGELRPQNYEELVFCVGCHGGIGGNRDGIFSFDRKFEDAGTGYGWYHWSQRSLRGVPEPQREDGEHEYSHYLTINGSGNEFRTNGEIRERFFDEQGELRPEMLGQLHQDVATLLFASAERAMLLNKAYRVIVQEQSFIQGRDATVTPLENVHRQVEPQQPTGLDYPVSAF